MHQFNRFYLLGSVLISFIIPAFIIYVEAAPIITEATPTVIAETNTSAFVETPIIDSPTDNSISYMTYLFWFYGLISSILFIRFFKSLFSIVRKIKKNQKTTYSKATLVLVDDPILPYTFWNYIFINKTSFESGKIETELFTHELTHVTQKHTIDVLLIEILQAVFWINPFFFLLKKYIQLNHEFLADDSVIASHKNISEYQHLLLDKAAWKNEYYLASNLNYSLTKKRLLMMKKQNSKSNILIKKLAIVPLLTGLVFLFANRVEAQSKKNIEAVKTNKETTKSQVKTKKSKVRTTKKVTPETFYAGTKIVVYEKGIQYNDTIIGGTPIVNKLYENLTEEEKKKNFLISSVPKPAPIRVPTKSEMKEYLNAKVFRIWIDGKEVANSKLNNYKASDFKSHSGRMFVHKTGRKVHPQAFNVMFYTPEYFDSKNMGKQKTKFSGNEIISYRSVKRVYKNFKK